MTTETPAEMTEEEMALQEDQMILEKYLPDRFEIGYAAELPSEFPESKEGIRDENGEDIPYFAWWVAERDGKKFRNFIAMTEGPRDDESTGKIMEILKINAACYLVGTLP